MVDYKFQESSHFLQTWKQNIEPFSVFETYYVMGLFS